MNPEKAIGLLVALVALAALVAAVAVAFLWTNRGSSTLGFKVPVGVEVAMEVESEAAPQAGRVVAEDLEAVGDLTPVGRTGGDVEHKRAKSESDITLGTEAPEGGADPKH